MKKIKYRVLDSGYESAGDFLYHSKRFNKDVLIPDGFFSDGASGVVDIDSNAWWIHDYLCRYGTWSDGTKASTLEASITLYDILKEEGRYIRAPFWFIGTLVYGVLDDIRTSFKYNNKHE